MSDNLRRYRARRDALTQCYPGQPSGTVARHLITLAALISGIVGSKSAQLPHSAATVPNGTKPESRVKRFARWVDNAHLLEEVYFLPSADVWLRHLAWQTVVLVLDGSGVGRGCTALMIHVGVPGAAAGKCTVSYLAQNISFFPGTWLVHNAGKINASGKANGRGFLATLW